MVVYSIVVPAYNAGKYLKTCIESILAQNTISEYEIIIVNDGSNDNTREICDAFASRYSCVKPIHQNNQGVAAARNNGIASAVGEYVLFLDGDDYWMPGLLECLDKFAVKHPDMVEFGYKKVYANGDESVTLPAFIGKGETGTVYLDCLFEKGNMFIGSSCTTAFRKKFLVQEQLRFPTGIRYGEDLSFRMDCLKRAQSVWGINKAFYSYRMHGESTIHTPSLHKLRDMLLVCANVYRTHPAVVLAEYYCMSTLHIARLSRNDARQLYALLGDNRDILGHVSSKKAKIVRTLYRTFGWYTGAKLIRVMVHLKHIGKAEKE